MSDRGRWVGLAASVLLACSAGPSSAPTAAVPTPGAAAVGLGTCEELVEHVRDSGGVSLTGGAELDPLCEWRVDDANQQAQGQEPRLAAGVLATSGRLELARVERAFRSKEREVARCVRRATLPAPILRARVHFDAEGRVRSTLTDYRVELADRERSCVEQALRSLRVPPAPSKRTQTVVYGFAVRR